MEKIVTPIKVTKVNFAPYGDLISSDGVEPMNINSGYAKRFDNLANINISKDKGETIVSIFSAIKRTFPMKVQSCIFIII